MADFCALLAVPAAIFAVVFNVLNPLATEPRFYVLPALFAAALLVGELSRLGGYGPRQLSRLYRQLTHAMMVWGVTVPVLLLAAVLRKTSQSYPRGWALAWITSAPARILIGRGILHYAIIAFVRNGYLTHNVVTIGAGNEGQQLVAQLEKSQDKSIPIRGTSDASRIRLCSNRKLSLCIWRTAYDAHYRISLPQSVRKPSRAWRPIEIAGVQYNLYLTCQ